MAASDICTTSNFHTKYCNNLTRELINYDMCVRRGAIFYIIPDERHFGLLYIVPVIKYEHFKNWLGLKASLRPSKEEAEYLPALWLWCVPVCGLGRPVRVLNFGNNVERGSHFEFFWLHEIGARKQFWVTECVFHGVAERWWSWV